jgi:hypothetical protein
MCDAAAPISVSSVTHVTSACHDCCLLPLLLVSRASAAAAAAAAASSWQVMVDAWERLDCVTRCLISTSHVTHLIPTIVPAVAAAATLVR